MAVSDFIVGPFLTGIEARELITEIVVPIPPDGSGSAYVSVEHPASGYALAGAAALVTPEHETTTVTAVGATAFVLPPGDVRAAMGEARIYGDRFAPTEYRRELAVVVAERALTSARERAKEER
jgi:carbon-monoxide dehydrogenase medium subunit